jgi:hypothetical protein
MFPAHRLAPCAALLLVATAPHAHCATDITGAHAAALEAASVAPPPSARVTVASQYVSRGLSRRLEGGWTIALNYTRAIGGGTGIYERYDSGKLRTDGRPWAASAGRRALVLSLTHKF